MWKVFIKNKKELIFNKDHLQSYLNQSTNFIKDYQVKTFLIEDECIVYPGHDYNGNLSTSIKEEKKYNSRAFEGQSLEKFIEIMDGLKLRVPEKLHLSVPSNLIGGVEWTKPTLLKDGIYYGAHTHKHDLDEIKDNVKLFVNLMGRDESTFDEDQDLVIYSK
jgi:hypothetical protein